MSPENTILFLLGMQGLTALVLTAVAVALYRLAGAVSNLQPAVAEPRPVGNQTLNLYDTAAYFVEWCQANDHHGEQHFSRLWLLYQKYCAIRGVSESEMQSQNTLALRLGHLIGPSKTVSIGSGKARRRAQVFFVPEALDFLNDASPNERIAA